MGQLQSPSLVLFPVLGLCCGTFSPSRHRVISEGWNKNAACPSCVLHVQSLTQFLPKWSYFIWKEGERWGGRFGCGGKGMLHLFPGLLGLWPWLGQPEALARIAFFSHWVQQWRRVFGVFFFLHHVASSQENTIDTFLLSSSSQSPSTYVATLSRAQNACI